MNDWSIFEELLGLLALRSEAVGARLLEHPSAQFDDLAGLFGERNEHRWWNRPPS